MAKPKKIAFTELPWSAARAWLVAQGLERVAQAIDVDYGTLRAALSRDHLPAAMCDKLAQLSPGRYVADDYYLHPRLGQLRLQEQHAKAKHAEFLSFAPRLQLVQNIC